MRKDIQAEWVRRIRDVEAFPPNDQITLLTMEDGKLSFSVEGILVRMYHEETGEGQWVYDAERYTNEVPFILPDNLLTAKEQAEEDYTPGFHTPQVVRDWAELPVDLCECLWVNSLRSTPLPPEAMADWIEDDIFDDLSPNDMWHSG